MSLADTCCHGNPLNTLLSRVQGDVLYQTTALPMKTGTGVVPGGNVFNPTDSLVFSHHHKLRSCGMEVGNGKDSHIYYLGVFPSQNKLKMVVWKKTDCRAGLVRIKKNTEHGTNINIYKNVYLITSNTGIWLI